MRHRARRPALALAGWVAAWAGAACHQAAPAAAPAGAPPPATGPAPGPTTGPSSGPAVDPAALAAQAAASKADTATVAQVLDGAVPAGRVVRVTGRCLGYGGRAADGPPPRTRSDWLLGSGARAVYVVGALPPGCAAMGGGPDSVTVRARAAADTAAGLRGAEVRRHLVRVPDGRGA